MKLVLLISIYGYSPFPKGLVFVTVHKSKGLQFDTVYLLGFSGQDMHNKGKNSYTFVHCTFVPGIMIIIIFPILMQES